jgi:O-antigen/teichoic acid export membrane protein
MDVPHRSLISAATAQISYAWKEKDMEKIGRLYRKTALNLLIAAIGIFGLLLINADSIVEFLGPTYAPIPMLLLVLGLARLIDLGTGLNSQILVLSKHWWIDLLSNLFFVAASIVLNYFLTIRMGVMGPAWGGLVAIILFNALRFSFLWKLYKLQPFTMQNLKALGIGAIAFLIAYMVPKTGSLYLDVFLRTVLFTVVFGGAIVYFTISEDLNQGLKTLKSKLR